MQKCLKHFGISKDIVGIRHRVPECFRRLQIREVNTKMAKPIESFKEGSFDVAIWDNGDDKKSLSLRKSWKKDTDKDWNEVKMTVFPKELPNLIKVLNDAKAKL